MNHKSHLYKNLNTSAGSYSICLLFLNSSRIRFLSFYNPLGKRKWMENKLTTYKTIFNIHFQHPEPTNWGCLQLSSHPSQSFPLPDLTGTSQHMGFFLIQFSPPVHTVWKTLLIPKYIWPMCICSVLTKPISVGSWKMGVCTAEWITLISIRRACYHHVTTLKLNGNWRQ